MNPDANSDKEDFPNIVTGNGIDRDLAATTNDRLKKAVIAMAEQKEALTSLRATIIDIDVRNKGLQEKIFWLTVIGIAVAVLS